METQQQQGKLWYQGVSLAISGLAPLIMYFAIRSHVANDTEALALAWFVPVAWTLFSSLWLRRLNLLGLAGVAIYGITLGIAIFFNTGSLPLKLHHAVVAGIVGLVCLGSLARGKPLLLVLIRLRMKNSKYAGQFEKAIANPRFVKNFSTITLVIGIAALTDAVLQTALALLLSTSAFLVATTAIHIGIWLLAATGMIVFFWIKSNR
jgi:hypothetical protein